MVRSARDFVYVSVLEIHRSHQLQQSILLGQEAPNALIFFFLGSNRKGEKRATNMLVGARKLTQLLFSIYNLTQHKMDEAEHNYFVP